MTCAYIGLGSNLNGPEQQIASALPALQEIPLTEVVQCSSFYRSRPLGPQDQPDYVNAAAKLETSLTAFTLLLNLQRIEAQHGRIRGTERWGPRTLDLDLLLYGQHRINKKHLIVPHPEIANRCFVLAPLVEIDDDLPIPGLGLARDLLEQVDSSSMQKITALQQNLWVNKKDF
ncbi:MAG: 2-amino-4-hydroxy-6-hydroxymethyldihydropteridine diphosphokinase [Gammaproteobacteria bacterium]